MAKSNGNPQGTRQRAKPLNYFYLNGNLHKKLHINRGADEITAWSYPQHQRVTYPYQMTRKNLEPAFTTREVAGMINRTKRTIERALDAGHINYPQHTYGLNERKHMFQYLWHESDVLALHAFLSTVHTGRPRKDGLVTPTRLPTVAELRAMMKQREILYVKVGDEYRPTWDAPDL